VCNVTYINKHILGFLKGIKASNCTEVGCVVHKKRRIRARLKKMGIKKSVINQVLSDIFGEIICKAIKPV
jgi:hypothetical protein